MVYLVLTVVIAEGGISIYASRVCLVRLIYLGSLIRAHISCSLIGFSSMIVFPLIPLPLKILDSLNNDCRLVEKDYKPTLSSNTQLSLSVLD
ncbi:hypothetical protein F4801DRAFT_80668 [Xylaria longipes]|nr:hypothetical protein F4801DRAFT_80668 [Xylaria longipes]